MGAFRLAVSFLTIIPVPQKRKSTKVDLAEAMIYFPLVGLLIGGASLLVYELVRPHLPHSLAVFVLFVVPIVLTGGIHMDGFADFCDGFFSGRPQADTLRIMKDPRLGAWGVLGLILLVVVKYELLKVIAVPAPYLMMAMIASRWSQVALAYALPYAGQTGGLGEAVAGRIGFRQLLGATGLSLLFFPLSDYMGTVLVLPLLIFMLMLGLIFRRKIGGLTGDLLGATSEMVEVFILFGAVLFSL